jgi:sugar (pentulose or hexulose) kinase
MTATTTKADLARAVMEGTSFSLLHCYKSAEVSAPKQVILTGGGARNSLWCQIVADVLGIEIVANEAEDHGLWGAALLGGAAAGLMDPLAGGARAEQRRTFTPDTDAHAIYTQLFDTYLTAIEASEAIWSVTRNTRSGRKA